MNFTQLVYPTNPPIKTIKLKFDNAFSNLKLLKLIFRLILNQSSYKIYVKSKNHF